jgi:DnaK suppressor protein
MDQNTLYSSKQHSEMDTAKKKELKKKIKSQLKSNELELIEIEKMSQPVTPENSLGRISRMDAINNKGVMDAAKMQKKNKISKLKIALSKIDQSDFGICIQCKNEIQEARLMFMPESSLCIRCASRR